MSSAILPPKEIDLRAYLAGCAMSNPLIAKGVTSDQEFVARCIYVADMMSEVLQSDTLPDIVQPSEEEMLRWAFGSAWKKKAPEQQNDSKRSGVRSTIVPPARRGDFDKVSTVPAPPRQARYHAVNLAEERISLPDK